VTATLDPPTRTAGAPLDATYTVNADLIRQLADVLRPQHAEHLLPPLLTVLHGHLDPTPDDRRTASTFVDVALVAQLQRQLGHYADRYGLLLAVLQVVSPYLTQPAAWRPETAEGAGDIALSARERQVLDGMANGRTNADIARGLYLGEDTVKTHNRRLFRKLGARDRAHAVARGYQLGILWAPGRPGGAA
jgi:DNA-binding CsgD family transcriptional regulator